MSVPSPRRPCAPFDFSEAHGELVAVPHERHAEDQRLVGKRLEPPFIREYRGAESELTIALCIPIDQRADAELLREASQLSERRRTLGQVHEVHLDPSLGEEALSLPRVGALLRAENLDRERHAARTCPLTGTT